MSPRTSENSPLLQNEDSESQSQNHEEQQKVEFGEKDDDNPRQWPSGVKYLQVFLLFLIGLTCTMAGSIFASAISDIAEEFDVENRSVLVGQTTFLCFLGIGPLIWAPMSETFGRRKIFLANLSIFTLLQIPSSLAPNVVSFTVIRAFVGLFGSVGVANGGGSISDMFETSERATVLGFYLLGPLLGPTLGPFIGAVVLSQASWRWIFWVQLIMSGALTVACYFLLHESFASIVLEKRKSRLESKNPETTYYIEGANETSLLSKVAANSTRACKILITQPIVLTMSAYQALIFSSMYSLYSNFDKIWSSEPYKFSTIQVGLTYLAPAFGFCIVAAFIVPYIDKIYGYLKSKNDDEGKPEFRLPLANIGAVLLPVSLFWFGWSVQDQRPWAVPILSTMFFGASQVSIFNTVQNYYIDAFEKNAASALAAGAFLRSIVGGIIPLFVPTMFETVGYGWGMSVFGFISIALMPAPVLFYKYGGTLREKFAMKE